MYKVIGLDLDGVLYPWHSIIYEYLKVFHGEELGYREFWHKAKHEDYRRKHLEYLVEIPTFYSQRDIRKHVLEAVERLAENNRVYYITTRPESARFATRSWLERSKLPYQKNLIITQNKRPFISLLQCDYFVDDKQETIDKVKDVTNAILFKSDYMNDDDVDGYTYIESLDELVESIL